jgi:hypothetical protein
MGGLLSLILYGLLFSAALYEIVAVFQRDHLNLETTTRKV